jgi:MFS family permease
MEASAWSIAAIPDAILKGREPPPAASLAQLPSYRWLVVGVVSIGAFLAVGGLLLNTLEWQWVFWINVPFGIVGAIAGWFILPKTVNLSAEIKEASRFVRLTR